MSSGIVYRAGADKGYHILTVGVFVTALILLRIRMDVPDGLGMLFLILAVILAACALLLLVAYFRTRYILMLDSLAVRSLLINTDIPYRSITEVDEEESISAFLVHMTALRIDDQVRVVYDGKEMFISPARKNEFLVDLRSRLGMKNRPPAVL